jgi:hypothetical protein
MSPNRTERKLRARYAERDGYYAHVICPSRSSEHPYGIVPEKFTRFRVTSPNIAYVQFDGPGLWFRAHHVERDGYIGLGRLTRSVTAALV